MPAANEPAEWPELLIQTPDGKTRKMPLDRDRITLGRASTNDLSYPDDAGLSRLHLAFERSQRGWTVRDLGSKNGTLVNGVRVAGPHLVSPNDSISAGHLTIGLSGRAPSLEHTVVFVEPGPAPATSSTVVASLEGAISDDQDMQGGPQMRALIRAGRELAGHRPLAELFRLIMDLSISAVGAARGVLMTVEGEGLEVRAARGDGFRISKAVLDRVLQERKSLLIRDARLDQALAQQLSIVEQRVRSILAAPLQTDNRVIGLIYLDSPNFVLEFTKEDLNLLTVMANVAAIRIEHARLAEVENAERLLAKELEQAAEIQRGLLPKCAPVVPGLELAGYNAPCRTVGGDYYDFIPYPDARVGLLVADVAGKGMPAAMLMSNLQARVQVLFEEDPSDLAGLVTRLNRIIVKNCPSNRFISFFIGIYDARTGDLTYCNAGHNPPMLARRDGTVETLESTGTILGILPKARFEQRTCHFEVGDVMALFSDGVTEAVRMDSDDMFGEERLSRLLCQNQSAGPKTLVERVNQDLAEWMAGAGPADDITLVIARRTA
jgi:serine phosphatase RsbU (regulator of sigma subunit)